MKNIIISMLLLLLILSSCSSNWVCCSKKIEIGMTKDEVRKECGSPNDVGRRVDSSGVTEMWTYYYYDAWLGYDRTIGDCTIFFHNTRVSSYQD